MLEWTIYLPRSLRNLPPQYSLQLGNQWMLMPQWILHEYLWSLLETDHSTYYLSKWTVLR
jgi:hypothetical protein